MLRYLLFALSYAAIAAAAPEPWSDAGLPVRDGLILWLDATKLNAGRVARELPEFTNGASIDSWINAAGAMRDVVQPADEARPIFHDSANGQFVRFDGRDDFLAATNLRVSISDATFIAVVAPRSNAGGFRAVASANKAGQNDYTSGFNVDLGGRASSAFNVLNAEGSGFTGERDLLAQGSGFGNFHVAAMQITDGKEGVRLFLDGAAQETRSRTAAPLHIAQFTLGARCCSSDAKPPFVQGFLDGDIAEVLVFERSLSEAELERVTKHLAAKHAGLLAGAPDAERSKPLVSVKDPPSVQMLVPGFTVRELPLSLTNIDCLRYRSDGRLVAGAYNGKIWLLTDTDADGLEDRADLFWESTELKNVIGMALTPANDPRGEGVFVATAGRILFIRDNDRDDRGDEQMVIATGWEKQASPGGGGSVDAVGVTLGPDGSVYFGLGTSAYNNAYLLDKSGSAQYQLASERGTILRISPDFSKREVVCTGIRYPLGAAFNRHGDLFVTEQEGATWLSNGNAFDELLHIEAGRHYGFPPRHPRHLPKVIDEPSTFDYGPQHQSTCGLAFNEPVKGGPIFGPDWWAGDAFVAGESRGKIWRTKLAKSPAGYVAQTNLIACLAMLTVDVAISPRGELAVACHSGAPDWGTGPEGAGKLFKIIHADKSTPQPVLTSSSGPGEFRISFDRPLDPARLRNFAKQVEITHGRYVAAGDRFELLRPGYQVVKDQLTAPRFDLPVLGATVSPDRRTLVLATPAVSSALNYAISLPDVTGERVSSGAGLRQHAQIDLSTDLHGIEVRWQSANDSETWAGWLPHIDLAVARELTSASSEHARLWELVSKPGSLRLRGQLDLWQMLHPAVQPGAKLDYEPTVEKVRVDIALSRKAPGFPLRIERDAREGEWAGFEIEVPTGDGDSKLQITWSTAEDPRPRVFPLRRFLLPWAKSKPESVAAQSDRKLPELTGGSWLRGRKLYFGKSTCHTCHAVGGEGGIVGPDLSNLIHRDFASVVRDIREPSAALNPDHLAYQVALQDGTETMGVLLADAGEAVRLGDATGKITEVPRKNVRSLQPLAVSLMPPGLLEPLTPPEQRDLLTFLLTPGLEPAAIEIANPPEPRDRAELNKVLANISPPPPAAKPLRVLLSFGPKDHGPGEHNYPQWAERWSKLLGLAENVQVSAQKGWPRAEQFANSDVIVFYSNNPGWNAEKKPELDDFVQRGGGVVFVHWAIEGREHAPALAECIGFASDSRTTKYRHGELQLTFPEPNHPITRGFAQTRFVDESYWKLVGAPQRLQVIGEQVEEGAPCPQLWAAERGAGRIFVSIPGHYSWTFDDPLFRVLLLRGICWTAKEPIDRLTELATIGARLR